MEIEKMITPRLNAILKLVPKCKTVCDVGTDHAYIPAYLVKKGICQQAIAMDLREGPLKRAKETVKRCNMEENVSLRLSNGLEKLEENEADVIVIAGMGGLLINEILSANAEKHKKALFILQPMTAEEEVRKYLEKNGFEIVDECLAREENKLYTIMAVKKGYMKTENELNYYIGRKLFENNDPQLKFAVERLLKKYRLILEGLKTAKNADDEKKALAKRMIIMLNDAKNKL